MTLISTIRKYLGRRKSCYGWATEFSASDGSRLSVIVYWIDFATNLRAASSWMTPREDDRTFEEWEKL